MLEMLLSNQFNVALALVNKYISANFASYLFQKNVPHI